MAKKDKGKVPKKIAGVKVPKALRKGPASSLLESPVAREILADVLVAAATAAAAALVKNRSTKRQVAKAGEAAVDAGVDAATATREVVQSAAGAVTDAARRILPESLMGDENGGESRTKRYAHLADKDRKGKRDKQRTKASKH